MATKLTHKEERWLTIGGALLIFATFVVKEAIRENAKDTADSLQTADYQFSSTSEISLVLDSLKEIEDELYYIDDHVVTPKREPTVHTIYERIAPLVALDATMFQNLEHLRKALPDDDVKLGTDFEKVKRSFDELLSLDDKVSSRLKSNQPIIGDEDEAVTDQLGDLGDKAESFVNDMAPVAKEARQKMEELKEGAEQRFEVFTWLVGWTMTLAGKLLGVEALAIQE